MPQRIQVTAESVEAYFKRALTPQNSHLAYGLRRLSQERFVAVMDALINGDVQVEELIRLGGFTDEEADSLLADASSGWIRPGLASPAVGLEGYAYLTRDLGLSALLVESAQAALGAPAARFLYAKVDERAADLEVTFDAFVLPKALAGMPLSYYLPSTSGEIAQSASGADQGQLVHYERWYRGIFSPILGAQSVLGAFLRVGSQVSALWANPGMAMWLLEAPRPARGAQVFIHREAAERTIKGAYTGEDLEALLAHAEGADPSSVASERFVGGVEFRLRVARAAGAAGARLDSLEAALESLYVQRDRLRGFAERLLAEAARQLPGDFPPG